MMASKEYKIGDRVTYSRTFTKEDVETFARISGDDNPLHLDEDYAGKTQFGARITHGIFTLSMFSKIFGTMYPGLGGIYMQQDAKFLRPVYLEEEIEAEVELIEFQEDKKIGTFTTRCYNEKGKMVVDGRATIKFP